MSTERTIGSTLICPACGSEHRRKYVPVDFLNDARAERDAALARAEAAEAMSRDLRSAVFDALAHAKRARFTGLFFEDGTPAKDYPIDEFNAESRRLADIAHEFVLDSAPLRPTVAREEER